MPKYDVQVRRQTVDYLTVTVDADNEVEALEKATLEAVNNCASGDWDVADCVYSDPMVVEGDVVDTIYSDPMVVEGGAER